MAWGSWGSGGFGPSKRRSRHRTPNGQHVHSCLAHHTGFSHGFGYLEFGTHGIFGSYYKEHCPGCRRNRSFGTWSGNQSTNAALSLVGLFIGGKLAKKSLWD